MKTHSYGDDCPGGHYPHHNPAVVYGGPCHGQYVNDMSSAELHEPIPLYRWRHGPWSGRYRLDLCTDNTYRWRWYGEDHWWWALTDGDEQRVRDLLAAEFGDPGLLQTLAHIRDMDGLWRLRCVLLLPALIAEGCTVAEGIRVVPYELDMPALVVLPDRLPGWPKGGLS